MVTLAMASLLTVLADTAYSAFIGLGDEL